MVTIIRQIDLNVFSLIMMLIILSAMQEHKFNRSRNKKAFDRLLKSVICMLSLDTITWFVNGVPGSVYRMMNIVANTILLAFTLLPPVLWIVYLCFLTIRDFKPDRRFFILLLTPFFIIMGMAFLSPLTGWLFSVSPENIYSRESLFNLMNIFSLLYAVSGSVIILKNLKHFKKTQVFSLFSFMFLPLIGGLLQILFYGLILYWNSLALSMIIMYLNVQSKEINLDYLTAVNSRRSLDNHLARKIAAYNPRNGFAVIMIDIDRFKEINDKFGHKAGDRALVNFSGALKRSVRNDDFIARYGGDEFVVVLDCNSKETVDRVITRIRSELERFNMETREQYRLDFSYGFSIYDENQNLDSDHFVDHVDKLMYEYKNGKKKD